MKTTPEEQPPSGKRRFLQSATMPASTTMLQDLRTGQTRADNAGQDTSAADVALGVRGTATAASRTAPLTPKVQRAVNKARKTAQSRLDFEEQASRELRCTRSRARIETAEDYDRRHAKIAFLVSWVPLIGLVAVVGAMIFNDPAFVFATLRDLFDVEASVSALDLSDPRIVLAWGSALVVTSVLLTVSWAGAKALAAVVFNGPLEREGSEALRTREELGRGRAGVIAGLCLLVLAGFSFLLHEIASLRLTGGLDAVFGEDAAGAEAVVLFITTLPLILFVLKFCSSVPQLEHARKGAKLSAATRRQEKSDVRRDNQLLHAERLAHQAATQAVLKISDALTDVGQRVLAEVTYTALADGAVDVTQIATGLKTEPEATLAQAAQQPRYLTRPTNPYLPNISGAPPSTVHAVWAYQNLPTTPSTSPLAKAWEEIRRDPHGYGIDQPEAATPQNVTPLQHHTA